MAIECEDIEGLDEALNKGAKPEKEEEDYNDEPDLSDELETANDMLRQTAVLLEFVSDSLLCKTITKRERAIIKSHLERMYETIHATDAVISDYTEE